MSTKWARGSTNDHKIAAAEIGAQATAHVGWVLGGWVGALGEWRHGCQVCIRIQLRINLRSHFMFKHKINSLGCLSLMVKFES